MREFKIEVNQEAINILQALYYECETRQNIIKFMLSNTNQGLNKELFDSYHKELVNFTAQYDITKQELQKAYVPEIFNEHQTEWNLDFKDGILTIKQLCECDFEVNV